MESPYKNFDKESSKVIKELAEEGEKFNNLVAKLNSAKENLHKRPELISALEKIKKIKLI